MAVAQPTFDLTGRLPPQNLDAERSLLGCMLLANESIDEIGDLIQPQNFYSDAHQRIADTIFRLYETKYGGIDAVTVAEELEKHKELDEIGGVLYLSEIQDTVPHAAHAKYYANIIRDKFIQRTLKEACTTILRDIFDEPQETQELLQKAEQLIFQILEQRGAADKLEIRDILMDAFDEISRRSEQEGGTSGQSTGFQDLDSLTSGLQKSELIIIAARPSMGKTAFACNIAQAVSQNAKAERDQSTQNQLDTAVPTNGVLLFSLEQSKLELAERLLCSFGKIDGHKLRQGELDSDERMRLLEASGRLSELPIFIDDQPSRSMAEIGAICRRVKRRYGVGLVIVDYLQLIEPDDRKAPREQQVARIARRLKALAKEMNIPVIALAQLNRGVELRENKRPRLADLRESGAIEQDADLVMFLHRPEAYDPADKPGLAELIVAKHRNGPTGIVPLTWRKECMRFENFSGVYEPEGGHGF